MGALSQEENPVSSKSLTRSEALDTPLTDLWSRFEDLRQHLLSPSRASMPSMDSDPGGGGTAHVGAPDRGSQ